MGKTQNSRLTKRTKYNDQNSKKLKKEQKEKSKRTKYMQLECNLSKCGMQQVSEKLKTGATAQKVVNLATPMPMPMPMPMPSTLPSGGRLAPCTGRSLI